jgi:aryl carrier-like protein
MEGIGYVSKNIAILNQARALSIYTLQEQDLLDAIQISIDRSLPSVAEAGSRGRHAYCNTSQLTIGLRSSKPLSDPGNRTVWKRDVRMSLYRQLESYLEETSLECSDGGLRALLNSAASGPDVLYDPRNLEIITGEIGRTICSFMMWPEENLDLTQSLAAMGVDSLVGIEIRNWWRRTLGVDISVLEIMKAGTVEHLGETAFKLLQEKFGVKEDPKAIHEAYLSMKAP